MTLAYLAVARSTANTEPDCIDSSIPIFGLVSFSRGALSVQLSHPA
jgi:hypothetical protein